MAEQVVQRGTRRALASWCLYDFANSPFTTLIVTFIYSEWFTRSLQAPDDPHLGERMWALAVTCSAVLAALLSPILGALADRGGLRKFWLGVCAVALVFGSGALAFLPLPDAAIYALIAFVVADLGFELGTVFYNAFLPDLAQPARIGRISGYGWALGYAGGLLALIIALVGFIQPEQPWFGVSRAEGGHVRATCLLVALWFAVFALPTFLWVREDRSAVDPQRKQLIRSTFRQIRRTWSEIRRYRQVLRLVCARVFYNDGIVTIFGFAAIYASGTFGMTQVETLKLAISVNVAAGLGAWALGFLDDRWGGRKTLEISVYGLIAGTLLALLGPNKYWLWAGGLLIGIFSGPNQSASRSLMGRFVPPDKENEFFGFLALSGKATAFLGPLCYGQLTTWSHSQRVGLTPVLLFFAIGLVLLWGIDEQEGVRLAGRDSPDALASKPPAPA